MRIFNRIQKENVAATALFGAGIIQIAAGALYGFCYAGRSDFDWKEWVYVFAAPIYFALSFTARRLSMVSLILGYLTVFCLGIYLEDSRHYIWMDGRILEFVIGGLFLVPLWKEFNLWEIRKGRPPIEIKEVIKILPYSFGFMISVFVLLFCLLQINLDLNMVLVFSSSDLESKKPFKETLGYFLTKKIRHELIWALVSTCVLTICVLRFWSEGRKRRKIIQSQKVAAI